MSYNVTGESVTRFNVWIQSLKVKEDSSLVRVLSLADGHFP